MYRFSDADIGGNRFKTKCMRWARTTFTCVNFCQVMCITLVIVMGWGIAYSIFGETVGIESDPFALLVLFGCAKALGIIVGFIQIPPILGMIVMGVILKQVGFLHLSKDFLIVTAFLRKLTLLSILLPAAFTLDPDVLKTMCPVIVSLATIPFVLEVTCVSSLCHYMIPLPWLWSLLLGFIMSASAPAIVFPCLFALEDKGYGNVNGIHTLITAACILDVIESITCFGLIFGIITTTTTDFIKTITKGPLEIVIGIAYGVVLGYVAEFIPHEADWYVTTLRTIFIAAGSLLSLFGSHAVDYAGAGVIGCFCLAYVANLRWRKLGWGKYNPVRENYKLVWWFFEPISYSLMGMEIDFNQLRTQDMLHGVVGLIIGPAIHFFVSLLVVKLFKYDWKEALFVALTFVSKATVQAALGPLALDYARETEDPFLLDHAQSIIAVTVVSILITSPIGMILLLELGPKLLKTDEVEFQFQVQKSMHALLTEPDHQYRRETRLMSTVIRRSLDNEL